MQIVVQQQHGLGNQIFQYAAGRLLAKKYACPLRIALKLPAFQHSFGNPRPFLLAHFQINAEFGPKNFQDRLVFTLRSDLAFVSTVTRKLIDAQIIQQPPRGLWSEHYFQLARRPRFAYLIGDWQTYHIPSQIDAELRSELVLREPPSSQTAAIAAQISACESPVSVHIRRGDYLDQYGAGMIVPMAYYENALKQIQQRVPRARFFVFTDDLAFARQWIAGNPQFVLVDHNDAVHAQEDLHLMSLCRHHIIANSTFSWWGAWLGANPGQQVIAPSKWPECDVPRTELLPPEWHMIEV